MSFQLNSQPLNSTESIGIAFIRFKNEHYHEKALKKDTFNRAEIKLNIKVSTSNIPFSPLWRIYVCL